MSEWISVDSELPEEGLQVLLYWKESKHIEDGAIYENEIGTDWYHCLFDGESLNCQPSHWMPMLDFPK